MIGQFSHDGIGWKTRKVCHQSLVGFDPSIVSQIDRFLVRLLLVGFVSVMDKSFVRRR